MIFPRQTPSIPRKGTETLVSRNLLLNFQIPSDTLNSPQGDGNNIDKALVAKANKILVRHPQFPARGRKRGTEHDSRDGNAASQTLSIPRKGTETAQHLGIEVGSIDESDTLNSPQGDGNLTPSYFHIRLTLCQTPSIPRKGTETPASPIWSLEYKK